MTREGTPRSTTLSAFIALVAVAARGGAPRSRQEAPRTRPPRHLRGSSASSAAQVQHGGVRWSHVQPESVVPTLELPGQLVPDEDHTARLAAPVEGRVMAVRVRVGDRVPRGQTLVVLQSAGGSTARADLVKAAGGCRVPKRVRPHVCAYRARACREAARREGGLQAGRRPRPRGRGSRARPRSRPRPGGAARAGATWRDHLGISGRVGRRARPVAAGWRRHRPRRRSRAVVDVPAARSSPSTDISRLWLEVAAPDGAAENLRARGRVRFTVRGATRETFEARIDSVGGSLDRPDAHAARSRVRRQPGRPASPQHVRDGPRGGGGGDDGVSVCPTPRSCSWTSSRWCSWPRRSRMAARVSSAGACELGRKEGGRTLVTGGIRAGENVVTEGAFAIKSQLERSKMPSEG